MAACLVASSCSPALAAAADASSSFAENVAGSASGASSALGAFPADAPASVFTVKANADGTAAITGLADGVDVPAELEVPATVAVDGAELAVTAIGDSAFARRSALETIVLPDTVASIGEGAFASSGLSSFTAPAALSSLGQTAFYNCASLASYTGNGKVSYFNDMLFYQCPALVSVDLAGVRSIGAQCFYEDAALSSLSLPDTLTSIGKEAFHATGLSSFTAPKALAAIGDAAFSNCAALRSVDLSATSLRKLPSEAFMRCAKLADATLPQALTSVGSRAFYLCSSLSDLTLPPIVSTVGANAFESCTALSHVSLPYNLKTLGQAAFAGCSALDDVTVPDKVSAIPDSAFMNCTSLSSLTLPDSLQSIGIEAFYNCNRLVQVTIPGSCTTVKYHAFYAADRLTSLVLGGTLPDLSTKWLGDDGVPDRVKISYRVRFFDTDGEQIGDAQVLDPGTSATAPDASRVGVPANQVFLGWDGVYEAVERGADCHPIVAPDFTWSYDASSKTAVLTGTPRGITATSLSVPATTKKGGIAYMVVGIGDCAFDNQTQLVSLSLPASVESIGSKAFAKCKKLEQVTCAGAKPSCSADAFSRYVEWRYTVRFFDAAGALLSTRYVKEGAEAAAPNVAAPYGQTSVGWSDDVEEVRTSMDVAPVFEANATFDAATKTAVVHHLTKDDLKGGVLTVPDVVRPTLAGEAYKVVALDAGASFGLDYTQVVVSANVASIAAGALVPDTGDDASAPARDPLKVVFKGKRPALAEGALPDGAVLWFTVQFLSWTGGKIGSAQEVREGGSAVAPTPPSRTGWTFSGWSVPFTDVRDSLEVQAVYSEDPVEPFVGEFHWSYDDASGTATLVEANPDLEGAVSIPATVEAGGREYTVASIGKNAFKGLAKVEGVSIPDTVASIGMSAFAACTSLKSVVVPQTVQSMGSGVFKGCTALVSAEVSAPLGTLPTGTFSGCTALRDVKLPAGLSALGNSAFAGCTALAALTLPASLAKIEMSAFDGCTALSSIALPAALSVLGAYAFQGCTALKSISVPAAVTKLDSCTFYKCSSLSTVKLGAQTASIGAGCFAGCTALKSLNWPTALAEVGNRAFAGCTSLPAADLSKTKVASIGYSAFDGCAKMRSFTAPTSLRTVGDWAFSDCGALSALDLSCGVETMGQGVFRRCASLVQAVLPDSLKEIGANAFLDCTALKKVTLSKGMAKLAGGLFQGCTSLEGLDIPSNIVEIGDSVFKGCSSIKKLVIPDTVKTIGSSFGNSGRPWNASVFKDMTALEQIVLPAGATVIGAGLFEGCVNLKTVFIPGSVVEIGRDAFAGSGVVNFVYMGDDIDAWRADVLLRDKSLSAAQLSGVMTWAQWLEKLNPGGGGEKGGGGGGEPGGLVPGGGGTGGTGGTDGNGGGGTGGGLASGFPGAATVAAGAFGAQLPSAAGTVSAQAQEPARMQQVADSAAASESVQARRDSDQAQTREETTSEDAAPEQSADASPAYKVVEVLKKAFSEAPLQTGVAIALGLALLVGFAVGAALRMRSFHEQTAPSKGGGRR